MCVEGLSFIGTISFDMRWREGGICHGHHVSHGIGSRIGIFGKIRWLRGEGGVEEGSVGKGYPSWALYPLI